MTIAEPADLVPIDELVAESWRLSPDTFAERLEGREGFARPPHIRLMARFIRQIVLKPGGRGAIFLPPRHGKALAVDTPIATPSGWSTMGELLPGDEVFTATGETTTVLAVTPITRQEARRVRFDDGAEIVCNPEHLWCTFSRLEARAFHESRRYHGKAPEWPRHWPEWRSPTGIGPSVRRTDEIDLSTDRRHLIPVASPLQTPDADLPLDPWLLGYWLGNGTRGVGAVTTGGLDGVADVEDVVAQVEAAGYRWRVRNQSEHLATVQVYDLIHVLRSLGVDRGQEADLTRYKRAAPAQRLALLQGLLDSDGTRQSRTVRGVSFTSTTEWLADLVAELALSLGHKVTRSGRRAILDGRDCGPCWDVRFSTPLDPFRLPRKTATMLPPDARFIRTRHRTIVAIEPTDPTDMRCITVADPSGMFLAGRDLIPTHNSFLTSIFTPAWLLAMNPATRLLHATYAKELGRDWSRAARNVLMANEVDDDGLPLLGPIVAQDSRAADRFETDARGGLWASAVGGILTGRGADVLFLDDLIRNYQDAHSATVRENTWQWYLSTARTRLQPGGSIVYVTTRWHEDDPAGRMLANDTAGRWEVLSLPAIAERDEEWDLGNGEVWRRSEGEALWPEMYPVEAFEELRAEGFSEYLWLALYQQRPAPPEGVIVQRDWWRYWSENPTAENGYAHLPDEFDEDLISVDCAFKAGDENDYVVMGYWRRVGVRRFLVDIVRARLTFNQTVDRLAQFHAKWPTNKVLVEDKANGPAVVNALKLRIPGIMERSPGQDSKQSRLMGVSGVIEAHNVFLPADASWVGDYVEEFAAFPRGAHDDQVDMTTQALREWTPEAGRGKVRAVTARSDVQVPMSPTGRAPKPKGGMRSRRPGER